VATVFARIPAKTAASADFADAERPFALVFAVV
jgi:hypothetical protein